MIYVGTDIKFQITTTQQDFSLTENYFDITIKNRWGQTKYEIKKDDCFYDSDGNFYFTVENVQQGTYFACFAGSYEDEDYDKQERVFTDIQELYKVGTGCCCYDTQSCTCEHVVKYTQVQTVSIDGADYLADCDGRYIYTSDGKRIQFISSTSKKIDDMGKIVMNMTGEEFLRRWESFDPNSEVDTIPELMHAMQGISDDKTVRDDVQEQIDENMESKAAESSDIDEIFGGASTAPTVPTKPIVVEEEEP